MHGELGFSIQHLVVVFGRRRPKRFVDTRHFTWMRVRRPPALAGDLLGTQPLPRC